MNPYAMQFTMMTKYHIHSDIGVSRVSSSVSSTTTIEIAWGPAVSSMLLGMESAPNIKQVASARRLGRLGGSICAKANERGSWPALDWVRA